MNKNKKVTIENKLIRSCLTLSLVCPLALMTEHQVEAAENSEDYALVRKEETLAVREKATSSEDEENELTDTTEADVSTTTNDEAKEKETSETTEETVETKDQSVAEESTEENAKETLDTDTKEEKDTTEEETQANEEDTEGAEESSEEEGKEEVTDFGATDRLLKDLNEAVGEDIKVHAGLIDDEAIQMILKELEQTDVKLNEDGYIIRSFTEDSGQKALLIAGTNSNGLFYGIHDALKRQQTGEDFTKVDVEESPEMPIRGVIEGFYGQPWSHEARKDLFEFMGKHRMNTYIYTPKDDKYLRSNWRDLYEEEDLARMKDLIETANANHVSFVYALSPGNDITYSSEEDYQATIKKFEQLRKLGVTQFYIALDDITRKVRPEDKEKSPMRDDNEWSTLADAQSYYLNRIQNEYIKAHGLEDLWMVPTNYQGSDPDPFKKAQGEKLDPNIRVQWKGEAVFSQDVTYDSVKQAAETYNTDHLFIWDNFPVNDGNRDRLFLQPLVRRDGNLAELTDGFTTNPMIQPYASWIAIKGYADYTWHPSTYDAKATQAEILKELAGDDEKVHQALQAFVDLNQSWENHLPEEKDVRAPLLNELLAAFNEELKKDPTSAAYQKAKADLLAHLKLISQAPETLKGMAEQGFYTDALPWIQAAAAWADASVNAVELYELIEKDDLTAEKLNMLSRELLAAYALSQQPGIDRQGSYQLDRPLTIIPKVGDGAFEKFITPLLDNLMKQAQIIENQADTAISGKASTNLSTYIDNKIDYITDGDEKTHFWSSGVVKKDDYVQVLFDEAQSIEKIVLLQGRSDSNWGDSLKHAAIEYTTDGETWQKLTEIQQNPVFSYILEQPVKAKGIRLRSIEDNGTWAVIREFAAFTSTDIQLTNVNETQSSLVDHALDGDLTTAYEVTPQNESQKVVITQAFVEAVKAKSLVFAGNASGTVEVRIGDTWKEVGHVTNEDGLKIFKLPDDAEISGIRFIATPGSGPFSIRAFHLSEQSFFEESAPSIEDLNDQIKDLEQRIEALENDNKALKDELAGIKKELAHVKNEMKKADAQLDALTQKVNQCKEAVANCEAVAADASQNEALETKNTNSETTVQAAEMNHNNLPKTGVASVIGSAWAYLTAGISLLGAFFHRKEE